jgi:hypothetical protein
MEYKRSGSLDIKMNSKVEERFVQAAREHGRAIQLGSSSEANNAADIIASALREIRRADDRGESVLLKYLNDDDYSVVSWTALYLLPLKELEATAALERVAQSGQPRIGFAAKMTLQEWRAGRLKVE